MDADQYTRIKRTIPMGLANIYSILLLLPIFFLPSLIFVETWGSRQLLLGIETLYQRPLRLIFGFFLLTIAHELIHGFTWQILSRSGWKDVQYGFKWKTLTPYAHLKKPIDIRPYRWGGAMPGILTGLLPALIGLVSGNGALFVVGVFMTAAAGGDMMVLWLLRKDKSPALVEDHPGEAGCYILMEKQAEPQRTNE